MVISQGVNSRRARMLVAVREMILRGEFTPQKNIEEIELSRALGASRPLVRATLKSLHQEGLVEERSGGYAPQMLTPLDISDAIEARGALESLAAGTAARRTADPSQLAAARRLNSRLAETTAAFGAAETPSAEQMAEFGELNLAFHKALVALAKSPMLELSIERVRSIAFASPAAVVIPGAPGGFSQAVREHDAILNAIETGNAARAEKLVRAHARFALRGVNSALDRAGRAAVKKQPRGAVRANIVRESALPQPPEPSGPTAQLVLDAAAALFCEKGFSETTTREIAGRLNIQQASLYYHISGKADLLRRICESALEAVESRVDAVLSTQKNARGRVRGLIGAHLEGLFENPDRALAGIAEFRSLSGADRRELSARRRNYSSLLGRELESAAKSGVLRTDIPVSILRLALLNYLNWTPRWYQPPGRLPLDDLAGIYDRVFIEGVVTPGHARPALPQLTNPRRRRTGSAHSGTLGKFVRTAAELFSKQGYASTSTRSLSALIGMEKATLYYHVNSKEDLLYLITKSSVETLLEDVNKAVEGIACPLEHLAMLIRAHCMSLLRDQTQHATALAEVRALSPERLAEIIGIRKDYQAGIRRVIEAGQKNGSIRGDIEPRYLASMLRGLLDRTVEWYQRNGSLAPAELANAFCEIYLFGAGSTATARR
ncbi:MAG TPA: TetR family transcriptional regulator [Bryobacteraceae bacterium]|nr:TetR family transcriptional regulator [Bryobacteraceae bacterium]